MSSYILASAMVNRVPSNAFCDISADTLLHSVTIAAEWQWAVVVKMLPKSYFDILQKEKIQDG